VKAERLSSEEHFAAETPIQPLCSLETSAMHDLIETVDGYRIRGSECCRCGSRFFPRRATCLSCASRKLRDMLLGPLGRLYSFTTVHVSLSRATPYTIGYVDLDEGVRLLTTISGDPCALSPDIPVRLTGATDRWTFEPVPDSEAS
jgi:uncharacterized OB-fold protein